jgi:hypothetical protein
MGELSFLNHEQRLYVVQESGGYSCLGFDVAFTRASRMAEWAGTKPPDAENVGTEDGYYDYKHALEDARNHYYRTNERCPVELTPQLTGLEGKRVEVIDHEGEKRRFWVGKSTGWLPCHLEVARVTSSGGMAAMGPYQSVRVVR